MIIQNGKPYPDPKYRGKEGLIMVPTEQFFFLLGIMPDIAPTESDAWAKGEMHYGLYTAHNVPFFLLDFPDAKMNFDAPLNALNLPEDWGAQNHDANLLHLVFIDAKGYLVRAQRAIGVHAALALGIKQAAVAQRGAYATPHQVDAAIRNISAHVTTAAMIAATKMYHL